MRSTSVIISSKTLMLLAALGIAASVASAQRVEETDPSLTYKGTWTPTPDPKASGNSYTASGAVGSSVTFTVAGTNFVLYRKLDANGGYADVTVDGNPFGSITFYAPQTVYQIPAAIDELSAGNHTIVLTVSQSQPQGSGGNNVYIDAFQTPVPASLGPTQPQLDAITRTNFYRSLMGLPAARHHLALGLAANAHALYLSDVDFIGNGISPHVETLGQSPDFTGAQPGDRDAYFGFTGFAGIEDSNNWPDPLQFVDGWMDGVYHRWPYLIYNLTEIGFGGYAKGSTMDFGTNVAQAVLPTAPTVSTYPANGQTDVWLYYDGSDGPNTVTPGAVMYGYPITLVTAYPANAARGTTPAAPTTGSLIDAAGNNVPVTITDSSGDAQLSGSFVMIPNQPLAVSTTYTANMAGVDSTGNAFNQTWKFTTANPNSVHGVRAISGNNTYIYSINWDMPGMAVPAQVQYGPTTAYGSTFPGAFQQGTTFSAQVPGLFTSAVTHFRVTATDAQGNVYNSPDHVINIANPLAPATIGFVQVQVDPQDTSFQFETAGVVATTQINYGLTTAYGSNVSGNLFTNSTTQFSADLFNLPLGTYHYQIVATDLQGKTFTTPDATFTLM